jgi:CRISPR-associated protein Csd1
VTVLQALDHYYGRMAARGEVANPGYSVESIGIVLSLSEAGELIDVLVLKDASDKKPRPVQVPKWFGRAGSGSTPYFLWDNTAYVLGVSAKEPTKTARDHAVFKAYHLKELQNENDPGLAAVKRFLEAWTPDRFTAPFFNEKMLAWNVAFRLQGDHQLIHEREASAVLVERLRKEAPSADEVVCLVTGRLAAPVRLHPKIKGVDGAAMAEVPLVSFNKDAFESYGKSQGFNAPTSEEAAFRYGTALNRLLDRGESRNRIKIADITTAFWADSSGVGEEAAAAADTFFGRFLDPSTAETAPKGLDDDQGEAAKLWDTLREVAHGRPLKEIDPKLRDDVRFHVLGLAPNVGRLVIRYWVEDRLDSFVSRLSQHYRDIDIEPCPWRSSLPTAQRLLLQTVVPPKIKRPFDYLDKNAPQIAGEMMRAILTGERYPRTLLASAIIRLRAGDHPGSGWHAAVIKACINRDYRFAHPKEKEPLPVSLDPDNPHPAYHLGRLFAVLESAQFAAADKRVNASIADRYYGAASSAPARVFGALIRGARTHISDANKRGKGLWLDPKMTEIISRLPPDLPTTLMIVDQGRFAVGYYHQRGSRSGKPDAFVVDPNSSETEEAPDAAKQ